MSCGGGSPVETPQGVWVNQNKEIVPMKFVLKYFAFLLLQAVALIILVGLELGLILIAWHANHTFIHVTAVLCGVCAFGLWCITSDQLGDWVGV